MKIDKAMIENGKKIKQIKIDTGTKISEEQLKKILKSQRATIGDGLAIGFGILLICIITVIIAMLVIHFTHQNPFIGMD